ncbi:NIPSNAP family protein [Albimonas pacifica]|uniref:NIPSNAP protein n=1 Tax=Albimonas pacifica TaxID=1114924 RepID=A0A1I3G970_9RHOB|nr:NIPSNAP family protein [Albimonas pacifica]SFI20048.1 NIPSNAP protein [Albimonas pacifica]
MASAAGARLPGAATARRRAGPVGGFAPNEGSATAADGVYSPPSLAAGDACRARLREDPPGREAFAFAPAEPFIRAEARRASAPARKEAP